MSDTTYDEEPPPYGDEDRGGEFTSGFDGGFDDGPARRIEARTGRTPPHNIQVEQSLLGVLLLSRDAIASALEVVEAAHFYRPAHQHIFEAITEIFATDVDDEICASNVAKSPLLRTAQHRHGKCKPLGSQRKQFGHGFDQTGNRQGPKVAGLVPLKRTSELLRNFIVPTIIWIAGNQHHSP